MWEENHRIWGAGVSGWGAKKGRKLIYTEKVWVDDRNQKMEELLRMWRGRKFQVAGAATASCFLWPRYEKARPWAFSSDW